MQKHVSVLGPPLITCHASAKGLDRIDRGPSSSSTRISAGIRQQQSIIQLNVFCNLYLVFLVRSKSWMIPLEPTKYSLGFLFRFLFLFLVVVFRSYPSSHYCLPLNNPRLSERLARRSRLLLLLLSATLAASNSKSSSKKK